jgi:hypothetical protein
MIDLNDAEKEALDFASRALQSKNSRTPETIQKLVEAAAIMAATTQPGLRVDVDALVAELGHAASVWTETPVVLSNFRVKPWWFEKKPQIEPMRFWRRYRRYLEQEKNLRDRDLDAVDDQTDSIIDRIQDPSTTGPWDVRGMVVGSVQSGKTANYVGVISKALDAGYKIVIVLAGIHKNLRAQTQERIDEGILGFDSQHRMDQNREDYRIGVGKLVMPKLGLPPSITPLTNSSINGDFTAGAQTVTASLSGGPIILVVKKNKSPLKNISKWLEVASGQLGHQAPGTPISALPLLMIDDEADNASINTKDRPNVEDDETNITTINKEIRRILQKFEQSAYIGYTATPFANIFINPEADRDEEGTDLFPRDFIVNVRPSSRYVGPAKVFGYSRDLVVGIDGAAPLPIFRPIDDHEVAFPLKHKGDHDPGELPASLKEAIIAFVLACAARRARGQKKVHNSMLVHVTWRTAVQQKVRKLVEDEFHRVRRVIHYEKNHPVWEQLKALWEEDFTRSSTKIRELENDTRLSELTWEKVSAELAVAADKISVREIHSESTDELAYNREPDGLSVIAVGANKLSRGLTLEGLSVSYFLRTTRMYDTLMQMGRWFGYRDGYLDLCRLYTTEELRDWFSHVAFAEEELKREFELMADSRMTPADYGLRVREHPDGMLVTALNKMAHGESREVNFSGRLVQTAFFSRDAQVQTKRADFVERWVSSLGCFRTDKWGGLRWTATRGDVLGLLDAFRAPGFTHPKCTHFGPELRSFIEAQQENGGLAEWTIVIPSGSRKAAQIADYPLKLVKRPDVSADQKYYSLSKANVQDPAHEILDLDEIELTEEILDEMLTKLELRLGGPPVPLIRPGEQQDAVTACIGRSVAEAAVALGEVRGRRGASAIRDEIRQLRPVSRGLMLIYLLDTTDVEGLNDVRFVPALALSFPATNMSKRLKYKVTPTWIKGQLQNYELEESSDEED